jgi:CheY-like chemotaxis protein
MSRRILLADDSVTIQKVIELTFMDDDYEVRAVGNGDEALAMLTALTVDFVIADVHMPGASGYEVCRRSKQLRPAVPVLLLVGTFEPFDEAQARECGADSYLKKPFDSQELLGRVHDLLAPAAGETHAAAAAVPQPEAAAPAAATSAAEPPRTAAELLAPSAIGAPASAPPPHGSAGAAATPADVASLASLASLADVAGVAEAPGASEPAAAPPAAAPAAAIPAAAEPGTAAGAGQGVRLTGGIEAAASWQEFELEAEPEFIPDPWPDQPLASPAATMVPASTQHFEQPFALGDLEEQEASAVSAEPAPAGTAAPAGGAAPRFDKPFTLGELDDRAFLLDEADEAVPHEAAPHETLAKSEAAQASQGSPPDAPSMRLTQAEPVSPYGAPRSTAPDAAESAAAAAPAAGSATATDLAAAGIAAAAGAAGADAIGGNGGHPAAAALLGEQDVERIARRVVELIGDKVVRDIAWEVIPDLAEVVIKDRLRELESQIE